MFVCAPLRFFQKEGLKLVYLNRRALKRVSQLSRQHIILIICFCCFIDIKMFMSLFVMWSLELCLTKEGSSYRGSVSMSVNNRRCLNWNWFKNPWGASKGIDKHNYCRYALSYQSGT